MLSRPVLLPLLLATCLWAGSAVAKDFQDWEVSCDNTRTCEAVGMSASDSDFSGYLTLQRSGDAQAVPALSFWADTKNADSGIAGKAFTITVDDKPVPGLERAFTFTDNKEGGMGEARLTLEETLKLLDGFKTGKAMALQAKDGAATVNISLNGAMATLLYMDDRQHRIGTVTALVRPGDKAASTIPGPPAEPVVRIVKPGKAKSPDFLKPMWARLKKNDKSCVQDEDDSDADEPSGETDALDATHALVMINCPGPGAYNQDNEFWLVTRGDLAHAKAVAFDDYDDDTGKLKPGASEALTNAAYDPKTGLITHFAKGRGIADCGATGSYGWDGQFFRLVGASSMGGCRGVNWEQWPQSWRARTVDAK